MIMEAKQEQTTVFFHDIIAALSYALDLTEGQPKGHSLRACWIGMHIGEHCDLTHDQKHDLFYTLILKDAGCSSNAERMCTLWGSDDRKVKQAIKVVDMQSTRHMAKFVLEYSGLQGTALKKVKNFFLLATKGRQITDEIIGARCDRGAKIALSLGLNQDVANGIFSLDEHYNGHGHAQRLAGEEIPLYSRIALLAQVIDVFFISADKEVCIDTIKSRSGTWFDPKLVKHFLEVNKQEGFWQGLTHTEKKLEQHVIRLLPYHQSRPLTDELLDDIAEVFGQVIDTKSPFTSGHSRRVAKYTSAIAKHLDRSAREQKLAYQGGLLHDLGKLGISNTILDSPNKLTEPERQEILKHPRYTEEILARFLPFHDLAPIAGAHHERLDGKGYYKGLKRTFRTKNPKISN